jgi:deazaflavin-dependent oxidoreductase (nitroreductase family)
MARDYRMNPIRRLVNSALRPLLRWGLGPRRTYLLSVPGRKSGRLYTTPVTLVEQAGLRWLVAPYGEVGWVRNARAAGEVTLHRGRHREDVVVFPLDAAEAAPVLKQYVREVPITRPYFEAQPTASLAAFQAEADRHPVFRIVPKG